MHFRELQHRVRIIALAFAASAALGAVSCSKPPSADKSVAKKVYPAGFSTSGRNGELATFHLTTTNEGQEEAGAPFDWFVVARDLRQVQVYEFNGDLSLRWDGQIEASWGNFADMLPPTEFTCTFTKGRCLVSGGPYIMRAEQMTNLSLTETSTGMTGKGSITITPSSANYLTLANGKGGPASGARARTRGQANPDDITKVDVVATFTADDDPVSLYLSPVDAGGNYKDQAPPAATFLGATGVLQSRVTLTADGQGIRVTPGGTPGTGMFTWSMADGSPLAMDYEVEPGQPATFDVVTSVSGSTKAGDAFQVTLSGRDQYGNLSTPFTGQATVTWSLLNSAETSEGYLFTLPASSVVSFREGVGAVSGFVSYNSAAMPQVRARLVRSDNVVVTGTSAAISVNPAAAHHFGVIPPETADSSIDHSILFTAIIQCRDRYGNVATGCPSDPRVSLRFSNGNAVPGALLGDGTIADLTLTNGEVTVNNFAYDYGGMYRMIVSSASQPAFNSTTISSPEIFIYTSTTNIDFFRITYTGSFPVRAGVSVPFRIEAINYAAEIEIYEDFFLNTGIRTWGNADGTPPDNSPLGNTIGFPVALTFVNGVATGSITFYRAETIPDQSVIFALSNAGGSITRFGRTEGIGTIIPNVPARFELPSIGPVTAGASFNVTVDITDSYGNPTDGSGTSKNCSTYPLSVTGGSTSPGGRGGTATSFSSLTGITPTASQFVANGIRLYKSGTENLTFAGCNGVSQGTAITVQHAVANAVYFNTVDTQPAMAAVAPGISELRCNNNGTYLTSTVACSALYAFSYDAYGNRLTDETCAWSYTPHIGAATVPSFTASGVRSNTLTAANFIDGELRCDKGTAFSDVNVYGGVSRVELTHNYNESALTPIYAGLDNITVSAISLFLQHGGMEEAHTYSSGTSVTIGISTDSADTDIGQPATTSCTFNTSGICTTAIPFDMTLHESNQAPTSFPVNTRLGDRIITLRVFAKTDTIDNINIRPAAAATMQIDAITAKTAGVAFSATARTRDAFNNLTDGLGTAKDCTIASNYLDISGGAASPGGHQGAATSPIQPQDNAQASLGTYSIAGIVLYLRGTDTLTFTACDGITANVNVAVNPATTNAVYLNNINASTEPGEVPIAEMECTQNGAASSPNVTCPAVYAFMYDVYGNLHTNLACDSWSYAHSARAISDGAPGASYSTAAAQSTQVTSTGFLDGQLTCTRDTVHTASTQLYGGVSRIAIAHNYPAPGPIDAALDNITVSSIQLYRVRQNNEEVMSYSAPTAQTITISTTSLDTNIGQPTTTPCTFNTSGLCTTAFPFDMTLAENTSLGNGDRTLTLAVRAKSASITQINILATTPTGVAVTTPIGNPVAGSTFSVNVSLVDAHNNITNRYGCEDTELTVDISAATASPGGHQGSITSPTYGGAAVFSDNTPPGHFLSTSMTLYNATVAQIVSFTISDTASPSNPGGDGSCDALIGSNKTIAVPITLTPAAANARYFSLVNDPASVPTAQVPPMTTELQCHNTFVTGAGDTACDPIYYFAWDAYGNLRTTGCPAWSYSNISGSGNPAGATGSGASRTITHTSYLDGNLTCTDNSVAAQILLWGGVSRIATTRSPTGATLNLSAGNNNLSLTGIQAYHRRNNVESVSNDLSGARQVAIVTDLLQGDQNLGVANPFSCTFNGTGFCATSQGLDLITMDSGKMLSFVLYSAADTISSLAVGPATPSRYELVDVTGTDVVAGEAFDMRVRAFDPYDNLATNFNGSDTLTFAWIGTTATSSANPSGNTTGGAIPAPRVWNFTNGVATSADQPFALFNARDGTITLDLVSASSGRTTNVDVSGFNVDPAAIDYVKIHTSASTATVWSSELGNHTMPSTSTLTVYGHAYDIYGNRVGAASGNWSGTGEIDGRLGGTTTGVSQVTLSPNTAGSGVITLNSGGKTDSTGTITINPGALSYFALTVNGGPSVQAGETFSVTVTAKDVNNNTILTDNTDHNLTWTWNGASNAPSGTAPKKLANGNRAFTAGQFTSDATDFALYNASNSGVTLTVAEAGANGTSSALSVASGPAASLVADTLGTQTAGTAFNLTARVLDAYQNQLESNCGTLSITNPGGNTSSGLYGGSATGPTLPGATSHDYPGHFTASVTLFKAGTNTLNLSACGHNTSKGYSVEANDTPNTIYLSQFSSPPAPGGHLNAINCSVGTTVTCPTLYSYAWDDYGNEIGPGFQCASWSYTDSNGVPYNAVPPGLSNTANAHTTQVTSSTYHVNGSVTCTTGTTAATTMNLTKINKNYGWSCSNWSCSANKPISVCTLNNTSGYDLDGISTFMPNAPYVGDTCGTSLAAGSSCLATFEGSVGSPSGSISVNATIGAAHVTYANIQDPAGAVVQGGAPAPSCP